MDNVTAEVKNKRNHTAGTNKPVSGENVAGLEAGLCGIHVRL